ncbi:MAG: hypothetical protein V4613_02940 [Bacteroidota bacterium]
MDKISPHESLDLYLRTLGHLDEKYVTGPDNDLEYYILEELNIDAHTFLHKNTVDILIYEELIPHSVAENTDKLRTLIIDIIERKRTLHEIRFDSEWNNARHLARVILDEIKNFKIKNI